MSQSNEATLQVEHIDKFHGELRTVTWHINSAFANEMSTKSVVVSRFLSLCFNFILHEVSYYYSVTMTTQTFTFIYTQVPLGVIHHNENKVDQMSKVMNKLHEYAPESVTTEASDDEDYLYHVS